MENTLLLPTWLDICFNNACDFMHVPTYLNKFEWKWQVACQMHRIEKIKPTENMWRNLYTQILQHNVFTQTFNFTNHTTAPPWSLCNYFTLFVSYFSFTSWNFFCTHHTEIIITIAIIIITQQYSIVKWTVCSIYYKLVLYSRWIQRPSK